jgi:hypothetical protein
MTSIIRFPVHSALHRKTRGSASAGSIAELPAATEYDPELARRASYRIFWEQVCAFRELVADFQDEVAAGGLTYDQKVDYTRRFIRFYFLNWAPKQGKDKYETVLWLNRIPVICDLKFHYNLLPRLFSRYGHVDYLVKSHLIGLDYFTYFGLIESHGGFRELAPVRFAGVVETMTEADGVTRRTSREFRRALEVRERLRRPGPTHQWLGK